MDMTLETLDALDEYVSHRERLDYMYKKVENIKQGSAHVSTNVYWSAEERRAIKQAFIDGAQVTEFNTDAAHKVLDMVDKLEGLEANLYGLGVNTYVLYIHDTWRNTFSKDIGMVFFTAEGDFYGGYLNREEFISRDDFEHSESALAVFDYALRASREKVAAERKAKLAATNAHRSANGAKPLAHWVDLEFIARKHGIPAH